MGASTQTVDLFSKNSRNSVDTFILMSMHSLINPRNVAQRKDWLGYIAVYVV